MERHGVPMVDLSAVTEADLVAYRAARYALEPPVLAQRLGLISGLLAWAVRRKDHRARPHPPLGRRWSAHHCPPGPQGHHAQVPEARRARSLLVPRARARAGGRRLGSGYSDPARGQVVRLRTLILQPGAGAPGPMGDRQRRTEVRQFRT